MKDSGEAESPLIKKLSAAQKKTLTTIRNLVKKGEFENPSDLKWANKALIDLSKGEMHESTMAWLTALVSRAGRRFEFKPQGEIEIPLKKSQK